MRALVSGDGAGVVSLDVDAGSFAILFMPRPRWDGAGPGGAGRGPRAGGQQMSPP